MIDMSDAIDYPIYDVICWGRNGLIKDVPPIFFDRLEDYIDEKVEENTNE